MGELVGGRVPPPSRGTLSTGRATLFDLGKYLPEALPLPEHVSSGPCLPYGATLWGALHDTVLPMSVCCVMPLELPFGIFKSSHPG